jgi:hypothetical protein
VGIIYRERKAPVASTCDLTESPDPELVRELKTNGRVVTKPTSIKPDTFSCAITSTKGPFGERRMSVLGLQ